MKTIIVSMISILISMFLTSCGEFDQSAWNEGGIHKQRQGVKVISKEEVKKGAVAVKSTGFPAEVSQTVIQRASKFPRDKHGMPTYDHKTRRRIVRTTSYSHMEMEVGAPWRKNAVGTYLKHGQVRSAAADWSRYPVGTRFKIKGLPYTYVVDDYGSALVGTNTVDIYHPTLRSMRRWGTRPAEITVIKWGSMERTVNILKGRLRYRHTRQMYYAAKAKLTNGKVASN